jgi:hypothetical protein
MDNWISPNNHAFVAFTVHFEHNGTPITFLLDIVEVGASHPGKNLAVALTKILKDYGIYDKVSINPL